MALDLTETEALRTVGDRGHRIAGQVSRLGVPGRYAVFAFSKATLRRIGGAVSSAEGHYMIEHVPQDDAFVVAFDHTGSPVNAAISDYVTPEPMA